MDDWVSIDEKIYTSGGDDITDDELRAFLQPINAQVIIATMQQCFSGGFIDDLSKTNTIIMTATEEETVSWGNRFVRNVISALSGLMYPRSAGDPSTADANNDGYVDMAEVFNFASENEYTNDCEIPQYDDNGDLISHAYPLPNGGDGYLGNTIYLYNPPDETPPATPLVSDEGNFTAKTNEIYASWTSMDGDSGIYEYQYMITEDSITGTVIRDWMSRGINNYVLAEALNLTNGKTYYFGVKARNGSGLWSEGVLV
ncbi:MAG: C13 family peptidase [Nitrospirota bacterium]